MRKDKSKRMLQMATNDEEDIHISRILRNNRSIDFSEFWRPVIGPNSKPTNQLGFYGAWDPFSYF